eukprot:5079389-Lingulodinium_polyedra.AAC.1
MSSCVPLVQGLPFHFSKSERVACRARLPVTANVGNTADTAVRWVPCQCTRCTLHVRGPNGVLPSGQQHLLRLVGVKSMA